MITAEGIQNVNKSLKTIGIKGKDYVQVNSRIAAFRAICPGGTITTDILSMENGVVTMKTTVSDEEGHVLATGFAQEKENASNINKTSYIENCETSAVGRALGMLGIGVDVSVASAEEMQTALKNQEGFEPCTEAEIKIIESVCRSYKKSPENIFPGWPEITKNDYGEFMRQINEYKAKQEKRKKESEA